MVYSNDRDYDAELDDIENEEEDVRDSQDYEDANDGELTEEEVEDWLNG